MVDRTLEQEIKNNVISYFDKEGILKNAKAYSVKIVNEISGMTNKNYHILVTLNTSSSTEPMEIHLFYRKFGIMSDCLNRELEQGILQEMSDNKLGPELILKEKNYCILEFITNSSVISLEDRYCQDYLDQIIKISVKYSQFSNVYDFKIKDKTFKLTKFSNFPERKSITYSLYNEAKRMLPVAIKSFEKFKKDCKDYYITENQIPNELSSQIRIYQDTLDNYEKIFLSLLYGNEGFFVINHNDMHRWNFVKKENNSKIYVIDHEYACMGLIGLDLANYMNENSFYFDANGSYEGFKENEVDISFYYKIYLKYLDIFKENYTTLGPKFDKYLSSISNLNYYLNLHRLTNTFWFLFCAINLEFKDGSPCDLLRYGCDRLKYSEKMKNEMTIKKVDV